MAENPLTARPQGAPALDSFCAVCNRTFQPGEDRFVAMNHGKPAYARHGTLTYSPCEAAWAEKFKAVAERQGQELEKRIDATVKEWHGPAFAGTLRGLLRRHFADLGASQQFSSTNIEGGRRFKQVLPNEDVGAQQQCTDRVEVPRRWVIAVNEFIEDWQKGDFNLPQLAALDAQAIIEAGADGPDLEACLNCGTDHSKGECRVVVAPASQDNPAPRCWCGRVLDDSAHLDNSLIHCEGEHGENKAHWFQPERRSGPAERRVTDLGCICAREKGRLHKYHDTTEPVSVRTGARDRRQPLRRAGVDLDQKQAADAHFKAKPAGTSSKPAAQNTTGYAATVPEVPTCHKCGAFMVKAKPVYDCPECGATTAITECTASPLVMAAQAQQFRFRYAEKQPADSQQIWRRAMTKPQGARRKSVPYRPGFLARLRDSKEALAYVTAALEDSEGMFITAINDVAEANQTRAADKQFRDCVPSEFTDKSGTVWTRRPR